MPKASDQEQAERCATPRRDLSKSEYTSAFRWRSRRIDSSVAAHASLVIAENDDLSIDEAIAKVTAGRWACVKTFADQKNPRERARQMRQRIRTGKLAAFRPNGRFDAVVTTPEPDGPTLVYASCRPMEV